MAIQEPEPKFNNGDKVRDQITGLTGIINSTTVFLNGCIRYSVQPQEIKDGKPVDATYFDEGDLELLKPSAIGSVPVRQTGGPQRGESTTRRRL